MLHSVLASQRRSLPLETRCNKAKLYILVEVDWFNHFWGLNQLEEYISLIKWSGNNTCGTILSDDAYNPVEILQTLTFILQNFFLRISNQLFDPHQTWHDLSWPQEETFQSKRSAKSGFQSLEWFLVQTMGFRGQWRTKSAFLKST